MSKKFSMNYEFEKKNLVYNIDEIYTRVKKRSKYVKEFKMDKKQLADFISLFGILASEILCEDENPLKLPFGFNLAVCSSKKRRDSYFNLKELDNSHSFGVSFYLRFYSSQNQEKRKILNQSFYLVNAMKTFRKNLNTQALNGKTFLSAKNLKISQRNGRKS